MTTELLARLGARDVTEVADQIQAAHAELPKEKCMAWLHKWRYPGKAGGCDIHSEED